MEFTLLGAALVAALAGYVVLRFEAGRTSTSDCTRSVWDSLVGAVVVGLVAGRLAAMIAQGTQPLTHPGDILIVRGGVDPVTASMAGLAAYAWFVRADLWELLDAAAAPALAGLAGWHAGCVVRDACAGTRTTLPWALDPDAVGVGRHPVEIYAAFALAAAVVAALWWRRVHDPRPGVIAAAAVTAAGLIRLGTEPMRLGLGSDLTPWYAIVVATGLGAVWWRWSAASDRNDGVPNPGPSDTRE